MKQGKSKMKYREQRFICGQFLEVNVFPVWEGSKSSGRRLRFKPTSAIQKRLNQHNRERECNRTICANFTPDDYYITLTYKTACTDRERAAKDFANWVNKINRRRKKRGLGKMRWLKSIEVGSRNGRIHIHACVSGGMLPSELAQLWGKGYVDCKPIMFDTEGCVGLARYFCKSKKDSDSDKSKSWTCSTNCVRPQPVTNDYKYSKRRVRALAEDNDVETIIAKMYPDYFVSSCKQFYHDGSGLYYLYLRMYRRDSKLMI